MIWKKSRLNCSTVRWALPIIWDGYCWNTWHFQNFLPSSLQAFFCGLVISCTGLLCKLYESKKLKWRKEIRHYQWNYKVQKRNCKYSCKNYDQLLLRTHLQTLRPTGGVIQHISHFGRYKNESTGLSLSLFRTLVRYSKLLLHYSVRAEISSKDFLRKSEY
jgi:hypothetical protein